MSFFLFFFLKERMNTHSVLVESGKMEPGGALLLYLFSKNVTVFCLYMRSFLLPVSSKIL